ncbi:MAG: asparagine synthase, partial [Candidatus Methanomethylophilaceae archaeon]|nr:asparagine synthase [Candidatus Methanomethylophilaceae archaeon]
MSFKYVDLENAIVESVRRGVEGRDVGVAFSGGLDSGLVSALSKGFAESVHLYTCGTSNAFDVVMARDLSERLGLPWTHVELKRSNIERYVRDMISATGTSDPFTVSYELQLFSVCQEAEEDVIVTGQGSDEYFMGCAKFVGQSRENYEVLKDASVDRLIDVS